MASRVGFGLALALAVGTAAAASTAGVERVVTASGHAPAVAIGANGRGVVAFVAADGSGGETVWAQRFQGDAALGAPFLVPEAAGGAPDTPVVAADASGDFVVAWVTSGESGHRAVVARLFRSDGSARTDTLALGAGGVDSDQPRVAMAADGRVAVAWRETGDAVVLRLAALAANGGALAPVVALPAAGDAPDLGAVALGSTSVAAAWNERGSCTSDATATTSAVATFDWSLRGISSVARFGNDDPCNGGPHVVGMTSAAAGPLGVFAGRRTSVQRFSPGTGVRVGPRINVAAIPACDSYGCTFPQAVAGDSRGRFVLVAERGDLVGDGAIDFHLQATLYGRDARPRGAPLQIDAPAPLATAATHPAAAFLEDGTLVVAWESAGGVMMRRLVLH